MVTSDAKHEMSNLIIGQMLISRQGVLLLFGVTLFVAGLILMHQHRREWIAVLRRERNLRNLKFELKKFRRRALVGSLLSVLGAMMAALHWVHDPTTFVVLTVGMFLLLIILLGLGLLDFMSVWLHEYSTVDDRAKKDMINKAIELHEARKKFLTDGESQSDNENPNDSSSTSEK
jgi:hypothetical protein